MQVIDQTPSPKKNIVLRGQTWKFDFYVATNQEDINLNDYEISCKIFGSGTEFEDISDSINVSSTGKNFSIVKSFEGVLLEKLTIGNYEIQCFFKKDDFKFCPIFLYIQVTDKPTENEDISDSVFVLRVINPTNFELQATNISEIILSAETANAAATTAQEALAEIQQRTKDAVIVKLLVSQLPTTGDATTIYVCTDTDSMLYWNGSTYLDAEDRTDTPNFLVYATRDYYLHYADVNTAVYAGRDREIVVIEDENRNNTRTKYYFDGQTLIIASTAIQLDNIEESFSNEIFDI